MLCFTRSSLHATAVQAQDDLTRLDKERLLAEHRASSSEQEASNNSAQLRTAHGLVGALRAQLAAKEAELEEANATAMVCQQLATYI